jgi:hypothetical protein
MVGAIVIVLILVAVGFGTGMFGSSNTTTLKVEAPKVGTSK